MATRLRARARSFSSKDSLDELYDTVQNTILAYQDPVTGLFPAFLLSDGSATSDAWVRDNTYAIMCVWALSIAYQKQQDTKESLSRATELEQAVVKHMRGLLFCMLRQTEKVEQFKLSQSRDHCLHAKYNRHTGAIAVGDQQWGHLQIDATSLYLLTLAQMTASGLQIVYTLDEVAFVQNLVFYIEEAYRIPDYGVWERGDKTNNGEPELNSSSIGMAKAALEALNGLDLFGSRGGPSSVIHVLDDEIQQCKAKLDSLLPRESISKEIDASLLSIIGFPAFAVENMDTIQQIRDDILTKLQGKYGCKRFLRDGYQTVKEDPSRLYYHPAELKMFENVECEWPLFFAFLIIDGVFSNNLQQIAKYGEMLERVLVTDETGLPHVPELYYVPLDKVEEEYKRPRSQERCWGTKWQSMWAQSLYILCKLLQQDYVQVGELDPLNRRLSTTRRPDVMVQVALVCEDVHLKHEIGSRGINVQTIAEAKISCAAPLSILPARSLSTAYMKLGVNKKMKLTGRPHHKMGILGTSQIFIFQGNFYAFTPQFVDQEQFYLWLDNDLLVDLIRTDIAYLRGNWKKLGRPTMTLPIMRLMLGDPKDWHKNAVWRLIERMNNGYVAGTRIILGNLPDLLKTSCISKLTFLEKIRGDVSDVLPHVGKVTSPRRNFQRLSSFLEPSPKLFRRKEIPSDVIGAIKKNRRSMFRGPTEIEVASAWSGSRSHLKESHLTVDSFKLRSPSHSRRDSFQGASMEAMLDVLQGTQDIQEQADILHHLCTSFGLDFILELKTGENVKIRTLLEEVYEKASMMRMYALLRHTAGLLHKVVEDLAQAASDLLVRQKQFTVGLINPAYHGKEIEITQPLSSSELLLTIERGCGNHHSASAVTQELIVYLAMFIRLEPALFMDMRRLRVGLIMSIVVQELSRSLRCPIEEATDHLLNLNPCGLKNMLYHLLSGKEFKIDHPEGNYEQMQPQISIVTHSKRNVSVQLKRDIDWLSSIPEEGEVPEDRVGVWRRRRRLDGALNRAPHEFYNQVWFILEHCEGIRMGDHYLPQRPTIEEMTSGEWKFALKVEEGLNTLKEPEYRQLVVEALMLVGVVVQQDPGQGLGQILVIDHLIQDAQKLFLIDQAANRGPALECCCKPGGDSCMKPMGICVHFYDSAPSGRYGTMSYLSQALVNKLKWIPTTNTDCRVS